MSPDLSLVLCIYIKQRGPRPHTQAIRINERPGYEATWALVSLAVVLSMRRESMEAREQSYCGAVSLTLFPSSLTVIW